MITVTFKGRDFDAEAVNAAPVFILKRLHKLDDAEASALQTIAEQGVLAADRAKKQEELSEWQTVLVSADTSNQQKAAAASLIEDIERWLERN